MKLNFWQWIGVLLLIAGGVMYYLREQGDKPQPPRAPEKPALTTAPA